MFSYGEIDCRCHSKKWHGKPESLSRPYVSSICKYIADFRDVAPRMHPVPVVLAIPPPTDEGHNPEAPFIGSLTARIAATESLNASLEAVCAEHEVTFTGADTWNFAQDSNGALRRDLS